jgi:hypothetical protein
MSICHGFVIYLHPGWNLDEEQNGVGTDAASCWTLLEIVALFFSWCFHNGFDQKVSHKNALCGRSGGRTCGQDSWISTATSPPKQTHGQTIFVTLHKFVFTSCFFSNYSRWFCSNCLKHDKCRKFAGNLDRLVTQNSIQVSPAFRNSKNLKIG